MLYDKYAFCYHKKVRCVMKDFLIWNFNKVIYYFFVGFIFHTINSDVERVGFVNNHLK